MSSLVAMLTALATVRSLGHVMCLVLKSVHVLLLHMLIGPDDIIQHLSVEAVMMHISTLEPEPRSLKVPVNIAVQTMSRASAS